MVPGGLRVCPGRQLCTLRLWGVLGTVVSERSRYNRCDVIELRCMDEGRSDMETKCSRTHRTCVKPAPEPWPESEGRCGMAVKMPLTTECCLQLRTLDMVLHQLLSPAGRGTRSWSPSSPRETLGASGQGHLPSARDSSLDLALLPAAQPEKARQTHRESRRQHSAVLN